MGLIVNQSFKSSVYSYFGTILGFLNVGLLMPIVFSTDQIGLTNLLISIALIIGQLGTFGFVNATIRLFPFYRDKEKKHNGFPRILLKVGLAGFIFTSILFFVLKNYLIEANAEKSQLFVENIYYLLPLIFVTIYYLLLDNLCLALFNASIGIFLKEFLFRVLNLVGIGLYWFNIFDFNGFLLFYFIAYSVPTFGLMAYLILKKELSLKPAKGFTDKKMRRELISVSIYGLLAGFSGIVVMNIDRYMVNHFVGLSGTGIYSTMFYFGTIIMLAGRGFKRIASPVIAEAFKNQQHKLVADIYSRSTITQLVISSFLFLLVWCNIDSAFALIPKDYEAGRWVVFFIGLSQVITMAGGVSHEIIQYSNAYKTYTWMMALFIIIVIVSNIIMIPLFGLSGAAIASAISYAIFGFIKFGFIKHRFKMQPYNFKHILSILISIAVLAISMSIPRFENFIIDLIIRSSIISIAFIGAIYFTKTSPDINKLIDLGLEKFFKLKRKH
ncbi:MAG: hypothetical protein GX879_05120 [Bacteroidales bacterium]|nr:hypothetical protein [Bacteroidales bacterium]